jgi:hypothetical protein
MNFLKPWIHSPSLPRMTPPQPIIPSLHAPSIFKHTHKMRLDHQNYPLPFVLEVLCVNAFVIKLIEHNVSTWMCLCNLVCPILLLWNSWNMGTPNMGKYMYRVNTSTGYAYNTCMVHTDLYPFLFGWFGMVDTAKTYWRLKIFLNYFNFLLYFNYFSYSWWK